MITSNFPVLLKTPSVGNPVMDCDNNIISAVWVWVERELLKATCLLSTYGFYLYRQWADLFGPSHHSEFCRFRRKWHSWWPELPLPASPTPNEDHESGPFSSSSRCQDIQDACSLFLSNTPVYWEGQECISCAELRSQGGRLQYKLDHGVVCILPA